VGLNKQNMIGKYDYVLQHRNLKDIRSKRTLVLNTEISKIYGEKSSARDKIEGEDLFNGK
jgi:hypothetical protein